MAKMNTGREIKLAVNIFGLAVVHALISMLWLPGTELAGGHESLELARTLARTGAFANPFMTGETGPSAHLAPLYPAYLSVVIRLFGYTPAMAVAVIVGTAIAFGMLLALLPALSQRLFGTQHAGIIAAAVSTLVPTFKFVPQWDAIFVGLGLVVFCFVSLGTWRLPVGIVAGIIILTNPTALLFMGVWLAGLVVIQKWRLRELVIVAAVTLAICVPWMARNQIVLGTFAIRDNLGLEMQVYNNDLAVPRMHYNAAAFHAYHPNGNKQEAARMRNLGEVAYNSIKMKQAIEWIAFHRARFIWLSVRRCFYFWFPGYEEAPFYYCVRAFTVLSLVFMARMSRNRVSVPAILAVAMVFYSLPYCVINTELRYRLPVLWVSLLFAGQMLVDISRGQFANWLRGFMQHLLSRRRAMSV